MWTEDYAFKLVVFFVNACYFPFFRLQGAIIELQTGSRS